MLALRLVEYEGTIMLDLHATADGLSSCALADADASLSRVFSGILSILALRCFADALKQ